MYYLVSQETNYIYIGITNNISKRFACHKHAATSGKKSPLYDCMRKHKMIIVKRDEFLTWEEAKQAEIKQIAFARENKWLLLNLADGGEGGYVVPEASKEAWKAKLSIARQGRKPALGMKHTEENKIFFSECSKRKKLLYPDLDVTTLSFKEAKKQYGISKTHYYRLLKRAKSNDLS